MFLCYLRPEKCQKSYPERHKFQKRHVSLLPEPRICQKSYPERHKFCTTPFIATSKNAKSKESIQFSRISAHHLNALINPNYTSQTTTWEHLVACFLNCRPIVTHSDSSTLAQDAILNCYKKPAHYYYHFSDFSEDQLHLV